jgi:hypothetical protein
MAVVALAPADPVFGVPVTDVYVDGVRAGSVHQHHARSCPCVQPRPTSAHHVAVCAALDGWRAIRPDQATAAAALATHRQENHP